MAHVGSDTCNFLQEAHEDSQIESAPASVMTLDSDVELGTQPPLVAGSANSSTMQASIQCDYKVIISDLVSNYVVFIYRKTTLWTRL